ncbi:MFS transporter [Bacillus sp. FJAT-29790]|uniref:MFS transporter n=1 Tax=Bacillus sp. FJAT-29790 TaxID=1895002 RepID=UPI001C2323C6|nr:MFS transporter [Bacillus sp. FJAT-29790]MBU8879805.1 MFS transporter [Bacillus sp. FJAT-29790]
MAKSMITLDDAPLNKFHFKMTALTFGGHFTDGYVLGMIGIALTLLTPQMDLNPLWIGLIGSSALIGVFLGSLILGRIADIVGRQKIFALNFVIIVLASILQYFADSAVELFILRVLIGFGLGGDYSVGHTMLAEILPRKNRGAILGSFSVVWTFGFVLSNVVGFTLLTLGPDAWRWMLVSSVLPASLILIMRIGTPESPRWLINNGRVDEAKKIVKKYIGQNIALDDEKPAETKGNFAELFSKKMRKRTAFNSIFYVCLVLPYFAIYTFLPSILDTMGLSEGFGTDLLLNSMLIIGALLGILFTIKFSRRGFLNGSFIFLSVSLLLLSVLPSGYSILMIITFTAFTLILSAVSNLTAAIPPESFPTSVRSSGVGFATAVSRLGSAIGTFLLPISVSNFGIQSSMLALTGVLVFGTIVSLAWAPETKSLTLNEASSTDDQDSSTKIASTKEIRV